MELNVELKNGQKLRGLIQSPGEKIKAMILLVHGLGEHILRYSSWADLFMKENIGFSGLNLPGHGNSDGNRGNIKNYNQLVEMIDTELGIINKTYPNVPVYIYGHSLGGGIVLYYLLKKNPRVKGAIVTSPWLKLSFEPSRGKLILAAMMKNILPGLAQPSGLNINHLSHDPAVAESYRTDPIVHGKISVSLFLGAMNAAHYSLQHASELKVPTLLIHGSDDHICSPEGSRQFAAASPMVDLKIWENGYHELHNEPFRMEVFEYIMNWINKPKPGRQN